MKADTLTHAVLAAAAIGLGVVGTRLVSAQGRTAWAATADEVRDVERVRSIRIQADMMWSQVATRAAQRLRCPNLGYDYNESAWVLVPPTDAPVEKPLKPATVPGHVADVDTATK